MSTTPKLYEIMAKLALDPKVGKAAQTAMAAAAQEVDYVAAGRDLLARVNLDASDGSVPAVQR